MADRTSKNILFYFHSEFLFQAYKFCMKMFNCVLIPLVKSNVFILYYINTLRLIKERKDNEPKTLPSMPVLDLRTAT
jgi:hypothetical protein